MNSEKTLLTVTEIARDLGVYDRTVRFWLAKGKLRGANRTGQWRIPRDSYEQFKKEYTAAV